MHDNMMLDDEYGGLLLEGKPALFKTQSVNNSSRDNTTYTMLFGQSVSTSAINNLSRGGASNGAAGFKPVQKQWI